MTKREHCCEHLAVTREKVHYTYKCSECNLEQCSACPLPLACNVCHQSREPHLCNDCLRKTMQHLLPVCNVCSYPLCSEHGVFVSEFNALFCPDYGFASCLRTYCNALCVKYKDKK